MKRSNSGRSLLLSSLFIVPVCGLMSSCSIGFGPQKPWTLEEEQQEKALMKQLDTARPEERESIQNALDDLRDRYKFRLDLPEDDPPASTSPALQTEEEKKKAADDAINKQLQQLNDQSDTQN